MKSMIWAAMAVVATPAAARVVTVTGDGMVQNVFTRSGGTTTLTSGSPLSIAFSFDTDSLTLIGSDANSAGYRFQTLSVRATVGDYTFEPAGDFGTLVLARGFGVFGNAGSEYILNQSFTFRGLAAGVPFFLPDGVARTVLALNSTFRYGDDLPPIDGGALTDPVTAARGNFTFDAVPVAGQARAGVVGPATAGFVAIGVPEPATWALMIPGFGAVGGVVRRARRRHRTIRIA